jgi:TfoX/Sxy family transcriptional regulator of competence genes
MRARRGVAARYINTIDSVKKRIHVLFLGPLLFFNPPLMATWKSHRITLKVSQAGARLPKHRLGGQARRTFRGCLFVILQR